MKTNFRRRFSEAETHKKRLALVVSVLAVAILIFFFLRSYILIAVSPLWNAENAVSTGFRNFTSLVSSKEDLIKENEALKQKLSSYDSLLASYNTIQGSDEDLLSHFGRESSLPGIAAGVLVHPPETPYDILLIDAGSADGITQGARVSLPEGGGLGVVRDVYAHESKVALYSGNAEETPAILERGKVSVTLVGQGGGTFKLDLPREVQVVAGDKVLLPGIRTELVGTVAQVDVKPTDSVQHVIVAGVANVGSIRFVTVH